MTLKIWRRIHKKRRKLEAESGEARGKQHETEFTKRTK